MRMPGLTVEGVLADHFGENHERVYGPREGTLRRFWQGNAYVELTLDAHVTPDDIKRGRHHVDVVVMGQQREVLDVVRGKLDERYGHSPRIVPGVASVGDESAPLRFALKHTYSGSVADLCTYGHVIDQAFTR